MIDFLREHWILILSLSTWSIGWISGYFTGRRNK